MTLITTTIALLHFALGATTAPAAGLLQVDEPAPGAPLLPAREAVVDGDAANLRPAQFRLAPPAAATRDPRLYRRDI